MFCPECGKLIPDTENICPECGCNVSFESEAIRKKPVKKAHRGGGAIAAGIIAVAVGVAALEGAWFFLLSPRRAALAGTADAAETVKQTAPVNVAEITAAPLDSVAVSAPAEADTLPDPSGTGTTDAANAPQAPAVSSPAAQEPAAQAQEQSQNQTQNQTQTQEETAPAAETSDTGAAATQTDAGQTQGPAQPTTAPEAGNAATGTSQQAAASVAKTRNMYILPNSATEYVTTEMLDKLTSSQVRAARNEIYARHGYIFKSEDLQKWFGSQEWYNGTISDIDSIELSETEWRNIEFINEYEETHG